MGIVLAGAAVLIFVLGMGYAFTQANPATLAKSLRYLGAALLAAAAIALALTERVGLAVFIGTVAWSVFTQGRLWPGGWPHYGFPSGGGGRRPRRDQSSAVRTEWIALELDHTTGEMDGDVLKGDHQGARLSAMSTRSTDRALSRGERRSRNIPPAGNLSRPPLRRVMAANRAAQIGTPLAQRQRHVAR